MTQTEFFKMYYRLDRDKFDLFKRGIAFNITVKLPDGTDMHTGIGNGGQMTMFALRNLVDLYASVTDKTSIEEFAESVKENLILAVKNGVFENKEGSYAMQIDPDELKKQMEEGTDDGTVL